MPVVSERQALVLGTILRRDGNPRNRSTRVGGLRQEQHKPKAFRVER
jgi:hypothetical protein